MSRCLAWPVSASRSARILGLLPLIGREAPVGDGRVRTGRLGTMLRHGAKAPEPLRAAATDVARSAQRHHVWRFHRDRSWLRELVGAISAIAVAAGGTRERPTG